MLGLDLTAIKAYFLTKIYPNMNKAVGDQNVRDTLHRIVDDTDEQLKKALPTETPESSSLAITFEQDTLRQNADGTPIGGNPTFANALVNAVKGVSVHIYYTPTGATTWPTGRKVKGMPAETPGVAHEAFVKYWGHGQFSVSYQAMESV